MCKCKYTWLWIWDKIKMDSWNADGKLCKLQKQWMKIVIELGDNQKLIKNITNSLSVTKYIMSSTRISIVYVILSENGLTNGLRLLS